MASRQNDALLEFENCYHLVKWLMCDWSDAVKKKFLLANKHITKLNSTLSSKVEELNAQISTLHAENLRLRASEIALENLLKRERDKSRKIMSDAEEAVANLMKNLGELRETHHIPAGRSSTPQQSPPRPRATRRPRPDNDASPQFLRVARPPSFPQICEDDEEVVSDEEDADAENEVRVSPPAGRRKSKSSSSSSSRPASSSSSSSSSSKLPLPARVASPPLSSHQPRHIDLEQQATKPKKKKISRRQSGLLSILTIPDDVENAQPSSPRPSSPAIGSPRLRDLTLADEEEEVFAVLRGATVIVKEEDMEDAMEVDSVEDVAKKERREKRKAKDKERDTGVESGRTRERERKRAREGDVPAAEDDYLKLKDVTNSQMSRAMLPPLDINPSDRDRPDSEAPTSASSNITSSTFGTRNFLSTPATTPAITTPIVGISHLPTPHRSLSPQPPVVPSNADADAVVGGRERRVRKSVNYAEPKLNTKMRKPDSQSGSGVTTKRQSMTSSARSSLDCVDDREPSPPPMPQASSSSQPPPAPTIATTATAVKRKKSRPVAIVDEDEESEGAQADAEYGVALDNGWVNLHGRRRSVLGTSLRRLDGDDGRRHSLAT
ncbi:hypothetical protein JAAARDRAFT_46487 [Jaapia argillacea MUCL 33604]|uniref:Shugoshin C-terminal domain-containing protein n=1 Tax=Jaapia argillacea MUCL 33604 TaxID=933084 RepID=A0A067PYW9_9AGAM|nr:hypothetical protein JAAARDRAFT_46487 [Jaapia argillacea MUCL 33604]